eukprot:gene3834-4425_t
MDINAPFRRQTIAFEKVCSSIYPHWINQASSASSSTNNGARILTSPTRP